jgi:enoyl-[acyl-carrier-protein] reductase (NADH)
MERPNAAPPHRNHGQVGDAALFLLSDLARGITGEISMSFEYHVVGMKAEDAPDIATALKGNGT